MRDTCTVIYYICCKALLQKDEVEITNKYTVIQAVRLNKPILTAGHKTRLYSFLGLDRCKEGKCTAENDFFTIQFLWI